MAQAAGEVSDPELRRALWRCRRGLKELDLLLERYARGHLPRRPASEQAAFLALLELPDPQLSAYLLQGVIPPEGQMARLVEAIRAYVA
jgi:antitoxin CptB